MSPVVHRILYGPSWDQFAELRRSRRVWCLVAFAAGVLTAAAVHLAGAFI